MRIIVVGPGRAGGALGLAAHQAGHDLVGVLARSESSLPFRLLPWDRDLPAADLLVIAVRDDAIAEVAERVAPLAREVTAGVHLSGFTSVEALAPLRAAGLEVGSFHPLQSLPDPETGAAALVDAFIAVTAPPGLFESLDYLARTLGARPFPLEDDRKPLYHAAASAAANFLVSTLWLAHDLFDLAGVPFRAARPLAETALHNTFELGPGRALTGPVARGDRHTVTGQLQAVREADPQLAGDFLEAARATARRAGTLDRLPELM